MIFTETRLRGVFIVDVQRHEDDRGFFGRVFCQKEFEAHGLKPLIAQINVGSSRWCGTVRGIHFQYPPAAESKYVRCTRGAVLDVVVDLRPESATYLQHISVELTQDNQRGVYIPERCGHAYQTMADLTDTTYVVGEYYTPAAEGGLPFDDPRLRIEWPLPVSCLSDKDRNWQSLDKIEPDLQRRMRI